MNLSIPAFKGFCFTRISTKALLAFFSFFMMIGGFSRFIELSPFYDNISVVELGLYIISAIAAFSLPLRKGDFLFLAGSLIFLTLFGMIGSWYFGKDTAALLYALRLFLLLQTSLALGKAFYFHFGKNLYALINFIQNIFVLVALLSLGVYVVFPSSQKLWLFLKAFGISFRGDPHQGRLVSVYFDPNFYGAIILLPLFLSLKVKEVSSQTLRYFRIMLFSSTLLFTFSRSAFGSFALILLFSSWKRPFLKEGFHFRKKIWLAAFIFVLLLYLNKDSFVYFWDRSLSISSDPSAYSRLESAFIALKLFCKYPLFGIGYNFYQAAKGGMPSPDSSLLATLIYFGLVGFCFLATITYHGVKKIFEKFESSFPEYKQVRRTLKIYLVVSIFFTSFFNNLLYYPYWILLIASLLTYFSLASSSLKERQKEIS